MAATENTTLSGNPPPVSGDGGPHSEPEAKSQLVIPYERENIILSHTYDGSVLCCSIVYVISCDL